MSDYAKLLLRHLQDQIEKDIQKASTFEERNRLTVYWYRLQDAIDNPEGTS